MALGGGGPQVSVGYIAGRNNPDYSKNRGTGYTYLLTAQKLQSKKIKIVGEDSLVLEFRPLYGLVRW